MKRYTKQWLDQVDVFHRLRLNLTAEQNVQLDTIQQQLEALIKVASEKVTEGYNAEEVHNE